MIMVPAFRYFFVMSVLVNALHDLNEAAFDEQRKSAVYRSAGNL